MEQLERVKKTTEIIVSVEKIFPTSEIIVCSGKKETFCKIIFKDYFTAKEEKEVIIEKCLQNVKNFQFIKDDILTFCIR